MRIFQCVAIASLLVAVSSQYVPAGAYLQRRQASESPFHKFLSVFRGGRSHREQLLVNSANNPYNAYQTAGAPSGIGFPFLGVGRMSPAGSPKVGAFYITLPEASSSLNNAIKKPNLVKLADLKNAQQLQLIQAESTNRPRPPHPLNPLIQMIYSGPGPVVSESNDIPQVPEGIQLSQGNAGNLQEIINKQAQDQQALLLQQKDQKAPQNQQINQQFLVPIGPGQKQVFVNQLGQPILLAPQQRRPQSLLARLLGIGGGNPNGLLLGQGAGAIPPQAILQQIRQAQAQNVSPLTTITGDNTEQLLKAQQETIAKQQQQQQLAIQQQQLLQLQQIQLLNSGLQLGPQGRPVQIITGRPQGQRLQAPLRGSQQIPVGANILGIPNGGIQLVRGPVLTPQGIRGPQTPILPAGGSSIISQPQFAVVRGNALGGEQQKEISTSASTNPTTSKAPAAKKEKQKSRSKEAEVKTENAS